MLMTEQERKNLRISYIEQYRELTGKTLICLEKKHSLRQYNGVARKYIVEIAANYSELTQEQIVSSSRKQQVLQIRQMISYLLWEMKLTFSEIGRLLNNDHSTIMNSVKVMKRYLTIDEGFKIEYTEFKNYCIDTLGELMQKKQKIDEYQRKAIRDSYRNGKITQVELAEIYNVHKSTIKRICKPIK